MPTQNIVGWGNVVPWADQRQIEQDLIISWAIVFSDPVLREELRFRGGTALNKLHFASPLRYTLIWFGNQMDRSGLFLTDYAQSWSYGLARKGPIRAKPRCTKTM